MYSYFKIKFIRKIFYCKFEFFNEEKDKSELNFYKNESIYEVKLKYFTFYF